VVLCTDNEDTKMPRKGHAEEQILQALLQMEGGEKAAEICRKVGISEQTVYT
jgi:predicted transcriptional regulator